jgi:cyclopropane-fatty-acyl-phospholipid synthase
MLWAHLLNYLVKTGNLTVIDASNKLHHFGIRGQTPKAVVRLLDKSLHYKLFFNPALYIGEAYMDGTLVVEQGSLNDFLSLLAINLSKLQPGLLKKIADVFTPVSQLMQQYNPARRAQKNVAHHYDLSDKLYSLFLDDSMQYSCAYYTSPDNSLEQAQQDKMRHIASKLLIKPGMKVLDIGSGWGGLATYLAQHYGADVTGVTLSIEQLKKAEQRIQAAGMQDKVRFHLRDYREVAGSFDRIVSVGMLEHVGVGFYKQYFAKIDELLTPDGIALVHSIGSLDGPCTTNAWLRKYIFPGGYSPALSEVSRVIEKSGLFMTDIEVLRMHYAYTLQAWQKRFREARKTVASIYDERFCRMWEFYLVMAEMEFLYMGTGVYQIQLSKDISAVPITRGYIKD